MNRCHRLRSFIVFATAVLAMPAILACQSTPADPDLLVPLGCEYRVIVEEAFNTLIRTPAEWFVLERGGALGDIEGEPWIIGSSHASDSYVPY